MIKDVVISAVVALVVAVITVQVLKPAPDDQALAQAISAGTLTPSVVAAVEASGRFNPPEFSMPEQEQDAWMAANRGAAVESKILSDPANSICFLTKVDFDHAVGTVESGGSACWIDRDEWTGWWQVNGEIKEGTAANIRCNAMCLTWN